MLSADLARHHGTNHLGGFPNPDVGPSAIRDLKVRSLRIDGVMVLTPHRFGDERGHFFETYRASDFAVFGIDASFVQDNQAKSAYAGTIRGLHFQAPPDAQAKLVRVLKGSIFDVAVDLRRASPTYGRWVGAVLTAAGREQIYVPRGFAHGYCTLEADTEIAYKCDGYYAPEREGGVNFADPGLGIQWPIAPADAVVSDKDRRQPRLIEIMSPF
jgi:dTDP-4-dehydrorhamnose 3,5-epimerase